jgi:hypothetical protein
MTQRATRSNPVGVGTQEIGHHRGNSFSVVSIGRSVRAGTRDENGDLPEAMGAAPIQCDVRDTLNAKQLKECEDASESGSKDLRGQVVG